MRCEKAIAQKDGFLNKPALYCSKYCIFEQWVLYSAQNHENLSSIHGA
jgi:hypothetical protein